MSVNMKGITVFRKNLHCCHCVRGRLQGSPRNQNSGFHTAGQLQVCIQAPSLWVPALPLLPCLLPLTHAPLSSYLVVTQTSSWLCFLAYAVSCPLSRTLSPFLHRRRYSTCDVRAWNGHQLSCILGFLLPLLPI